MPRSRGHEFAFAKGAGPLFAALILASALGGCVDAASDMTPTTLAHRPVERRDGVSLAPATVAIVSIDGAPEAVAASFSQSLTRAAKARDIVLVDAKKARYLVRGYLSAAATADGATLEYVWDIFGPDKLREQRLNDVIAVKGSGDDPWAVAGQKALDSVAAKSVDDLSAFLSNTPEAKPLADTGSAPALSYAADP